MLDRLVFFFLSFSLSHLVISKQNQNGSRSNVKNGWHYVHTTSFQNITLTNNEIMLLPDTHELGLRRGGQFVLTAPVKVSIQKQMIELTS